MPQNDCTRREKQVVPGRTGSHVLHSALVQDKLPDTMCGTAGAVGAIDPALVAAVRTMTDAQTHRGLDDSGRFASGASPDAAFGVALGVPGIDRSRGFAPCVFLQCCRWHGVTLA
jgi:hypothetical protein